VNKSSKTSADAKIVKIGQHLGSELAITNYYNPDVINPAKPLGRKCLGVL
jgi:hypothetical protein